MDGIIPLKLKKIILQCFSANKNKNTNAFTVYTYFFQNLLCLEIGVWNIFDILCLTSCPTLAVTEEILELFVLLQKNNKIIFNAK